MQALWPDSFVEEANLSFQVSALRKTLGEDGAKWIETLPRHGYRFNAVVKSPAGVTECARGVATGSPGVAATKENLANRGRRHSPDFGSIPRAQRHPSLAGLHGPDTFSAAIPLTIYGGYQQSPSLSPDGSQVAFSWNGPDSRNYDIYVKLVGPGEPFRLTTDPADDDWPAWSPDGQLDRIRAIHVRDPRGHLRYSGTRRRGAEGDVRDLRDVRR